MTSLRNAFQDSHCLVILVWSFLIMTKIQAKSSTEALKLLTGVVPLQVVSYEISYLHKLLTDLTVISLVDLKSILLYSDNMSAIAITTNFNDDKTSKIHHIDIHYHIIQEVLANNILRLKYIQTTDMTADILTKILPRETHSHHMKSMKLD